MQRPLVSAACVAVVLGAVGCAKSEAHDAPATPEGPAVIHGAEGIPRLLVRVDRDGITTIGAEAILDDATILERAEAFRGQYPHGEVAVECHPSTVHGRAVRVVELLSEAKIAKVAVGVTPTPGRRSAR